VVGLATEMRCWFDESPSVQTYALIEGLPKNLLIPLPLIRCPSKRSEFAVQQLPGLNLGEGVEQEDAEHNFFGVLRAFLDDFTNEILTTLVEHAICVAKEILLQQFILRPTDKNSPCEYRKYMNKVKDSRSRFPSTPSIINCLSLSGNYPESIERYSGTKSNARDNNWVCSHTSQ